MNTSFLKHFVLIALTSCAFALDIDFPRPKDPTEPFAYELSEDPDDIHFYFYPKNENPVYQQEIIFNNSQSLTDSAFNFDAEKTVFIIHGFTDNATIHINAVVLPAYLKSNLNYNIIVVDWGLLSANKPFSNPLEYISIYQKVVSTSIPIVAQRTIDFINFLGIDPLKLHIVGHSLGAHVSGIVGTKFQEQFPSPNNLIARITGLDPAGPLFEFPFSNPRINKSSALFVDVIHTNMGVNGDSSQDGHVDIYPNGGKIQPGCTGEEDSANSCSHQFVTFLYAASFKQDFLACECVSKNENTGEATLLTGPALDECLKNCPGDLVLIGVDCPTTARGLYSLVTSSLDD